MRTSLITTLVITTLIGAFWLIRLWVPSRVGWARLSAGFTLTELIGIGAALAFGVVAGVLHQLPGFMYIEALIAYRAHVHSDSLLFRLIEEITNAGPLMFGSIAAMGIVWLSLRQRWEDLALWILTLAGGIVALTVLKMLYAQPRPPAFDSINLQAYWEFPSGHAFGAIVCAGLVLSLMTRQGMREYWLIAAAVALAPAAMGVIKLVVGQHYFGDIVAGYAAGAAWLCLCLAINRTFQCRARSKEGASTHAVPR